MNEPSTIRRICKGALVLAAFAAAACTERQPTTPTEATLEPVRVSASARPAPVRLVVLEPVASRGHGHPRFATKVVYLRPVMRGDPLPELAH